jgi:hypothetical protein
MVYAKSTTGSSPSSAVEAASMQSCAGVQPLLRAQRRMQVSVRATVTLANLN